MRYRPDYLAGFPPASDLTADELANKYESLREIVGHFYADPGHPGLSPSQTIIARAVRQASAAVNIFALFDLLYFDRPNDAPSYKIVCVFISHINRIKAGSWQIRSAGRQGGYFMTDEDKRAFDREAPRQARAGKIETINEIRLRHINEFETLLKDALVAADGNQTKAARLLNMNRGNYVRDFKFHAMTGPSEWFQQSANAWRLNLADRRRLR